MDFTFLTKNCILGKGNTNTVSNINQNLVFYTFITVKLRYFTVFSFIIIFANYHYQLKCLILIVNF